MNNKDSDQTYDEHMQKILDDACDKVEKITVAISGRSVISKFRTTDNKMFNTRRMAERHQYDIDRGTYESNE